MIYTRQFPRHSCIIFFKYRLIEKFVLNQIKYIRNSKQSRLRMTRNHVNYIDSLCQSQDRPSSILLLFKLIKKCNCKISIYDIL